MTVWFDIIKLICLPYFCELESFLLSEYSNFKSGNIDLSAMSKFKISRRGRKLQIYDDSRTLLALPKDVPERTWAEILQKEENELIVFDIREEIFDDAMKITYDNYMERQTALFTAHCAAQAWLKLIDWHFYRHDPGEDPSAYPPCYIPKREESWIADQLPDPSPKDSWCSHDLKLVEEMPDEDLRKWPSSSSLDYPAVDEIPSECWFPGKVELHPGARHDRDEKRTSAAAYDRKNPLVILAPISGVWDYVQKTDSATSSSEGDIGTESEVLQKVTDYSTEEMSKTSTYSGLKMTTPVDGSLHGAGDSIVARPKKRFTDKSKVFSRPSMLGRSRASLPPLDGDSRSRITVISDCRLRNLRLDTQYEVSSEKVDTPPGETIKRK